MCNTSQSHPALSRLSTQLTKEVTAAPHVTRLPAIGKRRCPHDRGYQPQRNRGLVLLLFFVFKDFGGEFGPFGKPGYTKISVSTNIICSLIPSMKGMYSNP